MSQDRIKKDLDPVIKELKDRGISPNSNDQEVIGLGDIVEAVLLKFGITQERFKEFFSLKECNCTERKKYLNGLLSWHRKKNDLGK
jgi:hypothetical protein